MNDGPEDVKIDDTNRGGRGVSIYGKADGCEEALRIEDSMQRMLIQRGDVEWVDGS